MKSGQHYINGVWTRGHETSVSIQPSTGKPFGEIAVAGEDEINNAVASARAAAEEWKRLGVERRAQILQKVADRLLLEYGEPGKETELKSLITAEVGKRLPEADIEVVESSDMFAYFVKEGPGLLQERVLSLNEELWPSKKSRQTFEPIGVVGIIKPWNYPLELAVWAIAPSLIAGNTVVFKPSEHATFVGLRLTEFLDEAGVLPGVFNTVTGGDRTGRLLVSHNGIDMISFTGSVSTGREIALECAKRLRPYTLELGGNDAAIVDSDVNLELAANGLVWGAYCNSGQVCVRPKRVFVHESIVAKLTDMIVDRTKLLRRDVDFGPIISAMQLERIEAQVQEAVKGGATMLVGGQRDSGPGYYFQPTVLTNLSPNASLLREECFGPVMPIIPFSRLQDAVRMANSTEYGLGGSVWTSDLDKGDKTARQLQAGMVWVNDVNVAFPQAPWGGVKKSGCGIELSEWGLYEFVHKKHINIEQSSDVRRTWWYPYSRSES